MKCPFGCDWRTSWYDNIEEAVVLEIHLSGHEAERKRIIALLNWTHPESCEPMRRCDLIKEIEGLGR